MRQTRDRTLFDDDRSIQERFDVFIKDNPSVYELFKKFAWQAREAGLMRISSDDIIHRIRWWTKVEIRSREPFKINDHFSSRFARKLIQDDPTFERYFETRRLKAK